MSSTMYEAVEAATLYSNSIKAVKWCDVEWSEFAEKNQRGGAEKKLKLQISAGFVNTGGLSY